MFSNLLWISVDSKQNQCLNTLYIGSCILTDISDNYHIYGADFRSQYPLHRVILANPQQLFSFPSQEEYSLNTLSIGSPFQTYDHTAKGFPNLYQS